MNSYEITIDEHITITVTAARVKVKNDNTLIFYNPRNSPAEQYLYGSEVVATFNPGQYAYFCQC